MFICPQCYDPAANHWRFPKMLQEKCTVEEGVYSGIDSSMKIGKEQVPYSSLRELTEGILGKIDSDIVNGAFALFCQDRSCFWAYVNSKKFTSEKVKRSNFLAITCLRLFLICFKRKLITADWILGARC